MSHLAPLRHGSGPCVRTPLRDELSAGPRFSSMANGIDDPEHGEFPFNAFLGSEVEDDGPGRHGDGPGDHVGTRRGPLLRLDRGVGPVPASRADGSSTSTAVWSSTARRSRWRQCRVRSPCWVV